MITSITNAYQTRAISNSQEAKRLKKSISSSSNQGKSYMISSLNNQNHIQRSRAQNNSKSNKKITTILTSNSNKSIKALNQVTNTLNIVAQKNINQPKKLDQNKNGTIAVKNIKQKIVGKYFNQESSVGISNESQIKINKQYYKENKEDEVKKIKANIQKGVEMNKNKVLKLETQKKMMVRDKQIKSDQSLLNFSCLLKPYSEETQLNLSMFEIGRKLGKGRFGDVYMARDLKSGFVLAIKMINKKELKDSHMESQLIQQIKIQTFSNHPNVLKMYGFFNDQTKIYLLLELATNGCLFKEIRQKNYFEESLASFYFRQVASGVQFLHNNYVIHRDIKPENILNCFNVLKICDFGWAIYSPIYQRQTFCGTLDYVPPQIVTGQFYDEKADVWCLGVLCYELCTGKAPFESKTDENQTYDKILKVEIQFPIYLSPLVVDFIGKILNRDPKERMSLDQIESHQWMRKYENQSGRMISKDIWDIWIKISKNICD